MKQFIYVIAAMLVIGFNAKAQDRNPREKVVGLKATIERNNFLLDWKSNEASDNSYWEVQGSKDGKAFSTIGLVLGADPASSMANYKFKQQVAKIKPGFKYYRVLHIEGANTAIASNTIRVTK